MGKQYRPTSDAVEGSFWSGSPLFVNSLAIFLYEIGLFQYIVWGSLFSLQSVKGKNNVGDARPWQMGHFNADLIKIGWKKKNKLSMFEDIKMGFLVATISILMVLYDVIKP